MGKLADLRQGLVNSLAPLPNIQKSAYVLSSSTPPTIEIEPGQIKYDLAMQRGWDEWTFTVRVFVAFSADIAAQKRLDTYIDPTGNGSVKTLIETDRTLGGVCDHVLVTGCSGYRVYERSKGQSPPVLGAEWTVQVHVSN